MCQTNLHLDATGAMTKQVGETRPFFYSIIAEDERGSYPLGHMLPELHRASDHLPDAAGPRLQDSNKKASGLRPTR